MQTEIIKKKVTYFINMFEEDIRDESRPLTKRIAYSLAAYRLQEMAEAALPDVVVYLEKNRPEGFESVVAWTILLTAIEREMGLDEGPQDLNDFDGWFAWAKKHASEIRLQ